MPEPARQQRPRPRRMERWLYLDDIRKAPKGWVPVRTPADFVYMVANYDWDIISFDNDLSGQQTDVTGRQLLHWMFDEGHFPRQKPRVHSGDIIAAPLMREFIDEQWPAVLEQRRRR